MLERLKDIPWAELSHAYGSAADVPELLQALTADSEDTRKGAIGMLFANIYHQGSVYQASAYAAPFLLELLVHENVQGKDDILSLLTHLAGGDGYIHQHQSLSQVEPEWPLEGPYGAIQAQFTQSFNSERLYGSDHQQKMEEELFWVRKTQHAVAEGTTYYFSLLDYPDIQVKMNAALLLTRLLESANRAIPLFYTLFEKEEDERVKGNLIFALGSLDIQSERGYQFIRKLVLFAESLLLRFVAALVIVDSGREDIPHEAIDFLIQVATDQISIDQEAYDQIPAGNWKTTIAALKALQWLKPQSTVYAIRQLLSAFQTYLARFEEETGCNLQRYNSSKDFLMEMQADNPGMTDADNGTEGPFNWMQLDIQRYSYPVIIMVEEICRTLVALAFGEKRLEPGTRFRELSSEQQLVLTTLLNCSLAWHSTGGGMEWATGQRGDTITCVVNLSIIGLPSGAFWGIQREGLRAFVEQGEGAGEWLVRQQRRWEETLWQMRERGKTETEGYNNVTFTTVTYTMKDEEEM